MTRTALADHFSMSGISKVFRSRRGETHALTNVSLRAGRGESISLLGPSGCGKSTLLSLLAGLDVPTRGEVLVDGRALTGPNTDAGVVFQSDLLLEWRTALANVLLQPQMRGMRAKDYTDRARHLLDMVGIGDFADSYPVQLSGGMRQRVAICRALVHDPPLLLMDEPFGALDAITREQINLDLARLTEESQQTVVFVTHSIEEAIFLADRVVVLSQRPGRVVAEVPVPIPRPRRTWPRGHAEFDVITTRVRKLLEEGGAYGSTGQV